jgi:selenocysteine lyase/cysteine desulfurase
VPASRTPLQLVETLAAQGVLIGSGHFYSVRLCEALGIDPTRGVARISLVHYNTAGDVDRLLRALDEALAG